MPATKVDLGTLIFEVTVNDQKFKGKLKSVQSDVKKTGTAVGGSAGKMAGAVSRAFKIMSAAVVAFGAITVKTGADFEQQMQKIAALSRDGAAALPQLTEQARLLGRTTLFTATQAGRGMEELVKAGLKVDQVIRASGDAMFFAGAAGTDLKTSTALVASTMAQFSLDASHAQRITDVFSKALRTSLLDVNSLREAMKFAGTAGAAFGNSLEEVTTAVALFRNLGLEGSLAGTNLRMMLQFAAKAAGRADETLAGLGLTAESINPEIHSITEIFRTLAGTSITATEAIQIFGARSGANVAGIARLIRKDPAKLDELMAGIQNSAGETAKVYETMIDSVSGQTKIMFSIIQDLMIEIFDLFKGPLKSSVKVFQQFFTQFGEAIRDRTDELVAKFEGFFMVLNDFAESQDPKKIVDQFIEILNAAEALSIGFLKFVQAVQDLARIWNELAGGTEEEFVTEGVITRGEKARDLEAELQGQLKQRIGINDQIRAKEKEIEKLKKDPIATIRQQQELQRQIVQLRTEENALVESIGINEVILMKRQAGRRDKMEEEAAFAKAEAEAKIKEEMEAGKAAAAASAKTAMDAAQKRLAIERAIEDDLFAAMRARLDAEKTSMEEVVFSVEKAALDRIELERKAAREIEDLKFNIPNAEKRAEAEKAIATRLKAELSKLAADGADERNQIIEGDHERRKKLAEEAAEEQKRIEGEITQALDDAVEARFQTELIGLKEERERLIRERDNEIEEIRRDLTRKLQEEQDKLGAGEEINQDLRVALEDEADAQIENARAETADKLKKLDEDVVISLGERLKELADIAEQVFARISAAAQASMDRFFGLLSQLTGFKTSLSDLLQMAGEAEEVTPGREHLAAGATPAAGVGGMVQDAVAFAQGIIENIPAMLQAVADGLPVVIDAAVKAIPVVAKAIADNVGPIIQALAKGVKDVARALADAMPGVIDAVLADIDKLIMALVTAARILIVAIIEKLPDVITALAEMLPGLIEHLSKNVSKVMTALIAALPDLIIGIVDNLPAILTALQNLMFDFMFAQAEAFVKHLLPRVPEIAFSIVKAALQMTIIEMPKMVFHMVQSIFGALKEIVDAFWALVFEPGQLKQVGQRIWDGFKDAFDKVKTDIVEFFESLNPFKIDRKRGRSFDEWLKDVTKAGVTGGAVAGPFGSIVGAVGGMLGVFQRGIPFIPRHGFARVHAGEAIIPAEQNPANPGNLLVDSPESRLEASLGQTKPQVVQVNFEAEGRLLDGIIVTSTARGRMPKVERMMKKGTGVRVGLDRKDFSKFAS